jgi:hypothetical protein
MVSMATWFIYLDEPLAVFFNVLVRRFLFLAYVRFHRNVDVHSQFLTENGRNQMT